MQRSLPQKSTINPAEVNQALIGTPLAGTVRHFEEVESTNTLALEAAQAGVSGGVWVADAQTAGRGRGGHQWHSVPGDGLYVSVLMSPQLPASALELSLAAGLAAWEAVREVSGLVTDIRWPNDLVTRGVTGSRKLGGVLTEAAVSTHGSSGEPMLRYVVIGIGINVAHRAFPPELASLASSLYLEGWKLPDRQALLVALLRQLCRNIDELEGAYLEGAQAGRDASPALARRLAEASTWLRGKRVRVPEEGGYTGVTAGLDAQGFLQVNCDDGCRRTVRSGGVREF